jgi:hypothetical protein
MLVLVSTKEVIKEQSTPANLSATARRVLRCTRPQKPSCSFKEIFFGYFHLTIPETPSQKGFISVTLFYPAPHMLHPNPATYNAPY